MIANRRLLVSGVGGRERPLVVLPPDGRGADYGGGTPRLRWFVLPTGYDDHRRGVHDSLRNAGRNRIRRAQESAARRNSGGPRGSRHLWSRRQAGHGGRGDKAGLHRSYRNRIHPRRVAARRRAAHRLGLGFSARSVAHHWPATTAPRAKIRLFAVTTSPRTSSSGNSPSSIAKTLASPAAPGLRVPISPRLTAWAARTVDAATTSKSGIPSARNFDMVVTWS